MLEQNFVGKPDETKYSPARVLLRLNIKVWAEHESAEKHHGRRQNCERRFPRRPERDQKGRHGENERDRVVCFPRRHPARTSSAYSIL